MDEWISVDNMLPENNVRVLLYTPEDDAIRIGWHVKPIWGQCCEWVLITPMNSRRASLKKPSHWMPLPLKPRIE